MQFEAARCAATNRFLLNLDTRLDERTTTAAELATDFTNALLDAARTTLGEEPRRRRTQEWCETPETREALEQALTKRREARRAMRGNWNSATWRVLKAACKGVATAVETGIYAHLDGYVTELEEIYKDRDMRGLYQHLKRSVGLSGRQARGQQFVADENGVLLRNRDDILQRWARFFSTLLNFKSPALNPDIIERVTQRPATVTLNELEEVARATKDLKNWKAPGHDSLPAELLKIDDDEPFVLGHLHTILVKVWNRGDIPREWKDATIKVLYKKGDRSNCCNNYRGISLLSHVGKVPIKIITNRLSAFCKANNILRRNSADVDPGDPPSTCCSSCAASRSWGGERKYRSTLERVLL
ncbi:unnamed protein product [Ectocarpus sp. CCAP 1310/34]|nr:unnamed protein product [Ectocarpus sp. CCAP 1310/34]